MANSLAEWMRTKGLRRSVRAGVTLAYRGSRADSVLLVEQGSVLLERHEVTGNVLPISVCGRGALVGLSAAILDHPHDSDVTSRIDGEVIVVAAASMRELTTSPVHAPLVVHALASEARMLADRCAALQSQSVRDRVLAVLSELSEGAASYPTKVALPMPDLAVMVGADLAHVCRIMRRLHTDGVVEYGKRRLAIRARIARPSDPTMQ